MVAAGTKSTKATKPKTKAAASREKAIGDIREKLEAYRGIVHRAALGEAIPAHVTQYMEAILESLHLPEWTFTRDVRACRRHLAMVEQAKQAEGQAAEVLRDRAAELAFEYPHLLLPIELAAGMRLKEKEKQLARLAETRDTLRTAWSTYQ